MMDKLSIALSSVPRRNLTGASDIPYITVPAANQPAPGLTSSARNCYDETGGGMSAWS
jgi:hypothetical protein